MRTFLSTLLISKLAVNTLFVLLLTTTFAQAATKVVVPGVERQDYFISVLSLALSYHPEKKYEVGFINYDVPKLRAFKLIESHEGIDTIAAGATIERQEILQSVKIPLLKGLFGWRAALVHKKTPNILKNANSWEEFRTLSAGQLLTWSDVTILESNGIKVIKGANYAGLFPMLEKQRFDYFPRSILEIYTEYKNNRQYDIDVEKHILFHYPTAYYFYVNKENKQLAEDLRIGLESAISDGSFEALFQQNFGPVIDKFKKQKRRIIELHNPMLPPNVPLKRRNLWLSLYAND